MQSRSGRAHVVWWGSHPCRPASCRASPPPPPLHTGTTPQGGTDRSESVFVFRLHSRCYTVPTGPKCSSHLKHTHTTQNLALTVKPMWSCVLGFSIILTHSRTAHRYAPNVAVEMETKHRQVSSFKRKPAAKKKKESYFKWENSYKKSYSYRKHKMYMPPRSTGTATD